MLCSCVWLWCMAGLKSGVLCNDWQSTCEAGEQTLMSHRGRNSAVSEAEQDLHSLFSNSAEKLFIEAC